MEILIATSSGINFYDPSVVAPYNISREELVVRLMGVLLPQQNQFQKKAYKCIMETLGVMGREYATEVGELLETHEHCVMGISRHYRLAILGVLWNRMGLNEEEVIDGVFSFIKRYLP
jgi:hypothetical protein